MLGTIAFIFIITVTSFTTGCALMAGYKNKQKPVIERPQTKHTTYADQVIATAAMIYCNYNESKILRPGGNAKLKTDRYGEALQDALNIVNSAYNYFDDLDKSQDVEINQGDYESYEKRYYQN